MQNTDKNDDTNEEAAPYLSFYKKHEISPVAQDIKDLNRHFERRESLYRLLGIPPFSVQDSTVLEFGPGSGHNALYTASLNPKRYLLVDANPTGLSETKKTLQKHFKSGVCELKQSTVQDFQTNERFDLVLCEGIVPWQKDPGAFASHAASFTKNGGIFVTTCIDCASFLGESLRRLIGLRIAPPKVNFEDRLKILCETFEPDLKTLSGMSRSVKDWVLDNILIEYHGKTFSIKDCVSALGNEFEVYNSSPSFKQEWRWYKQLVSPNREINSRFVLAYESSIANFADYRITVPSHSSETGRGILTVAESIFNQMLALERNSGALDFTNVAKEILKLADLFSSISELTSRSFQEVGKFLISENPDLSKLKEFRSFFGRGQQYISLLKSK